MQLSQAFRKADVLDMFCSPQMDESTEMQLKAGVWAACSVCLD